MLDRLKEKGGRLKIELRALQLAALDPRTPWYAKGLVLLVVAYAVSPIDLIPDFVPVLGYLDDAIIVSVGIALSLRLIPAEVMAEARGAARTEALDPGARGLGAAIIILLWLLALVAVAALILWWQHSRQ